MSSESKPSRNEDEYFLKLDAERIKEMRERLNDERASAERKSHYMKCPKCGSDLRETDFHHVKVDICAACGGLWLDAGEIDMLGHVRDDQSGSFLNNLFKLLGAR